MNEELMKKAVNIRDYINEPRVVRQLEDALPEFLSVKRFLRTVYTALLKNPKLLDCTKESLLSAMIESAQLGLEPIMGKAALIPYKNQVQFQPMYRGLIDLARRTGEVKITAHVVYEKDKFDISYGTNEMCLHKPFLGGDRGRMMGAYTVWTFPNGTQTFLFMPEANILKVGNASSQAWQYAKKTPKDADAQKTPWVTAPGEMYKKTVIKRHSKLQPCSIEMERAIELDNALETGTPLKALPCFDVAPELTSSPAPDLKLLVKQFEKSISEDTNRVLLCAYLDLLATEYNCSVEEVRANAADAVKGKDFWEGFKRWGKAQEQKKTLKDEKEPGPEKYAFEGLNKVSLKRYEKEQRGIIPEWPQEVKETFQKEWQRVFGEVYVLPDGDNGDEPETSALELEAIREEIIAIAENEEIEAIDIRKAITEFGQKIPLSEIKDKQKLEDIKAWISSGEARKIVEYLKPHG